MPSPEIRQIPLNQIRPDPTQSRTFFDPVKLEDLKASLTELGLIAPISVRQAGNLFEIIAGERRFRAASALGWTEMECRVYPVDTPALETEYLSLAENLQRADLNPIEEARGYKQLAEPPYNQSQSEIAAKVGKKQSAISEALSLLSLSEEVVDLIARAIISPRHGRILTKITNVERQIALAKQTATAGWSVRQLEATLAGSPKADRRPPSMFEVMSKVDARDAKDAADQAKQDPLDGMWQNMKVDKDLSAMNWRVAYQEGKWLFEIQADPKTEPEARLGAWFRSMAKWFKAVVPNEADVQEMEASMPNIGLQNAVSNPRLPTTEAEMSELHALGKQSPFAAYSWMYGKDSAPALMFKDATWEDLGFKDPSTAIKVIVERLKKDGG